MRRSEVIGTCLVNSDYFDDLESAEEAVQTLFNQTYPKEDFIKWDKSVPNETAQAYIQEMYGKSEVDFKYLVTMLSRSSDISLNE